MRRIKKFKLYSKKGIFFFDLPSKLKKFSHTKWKIYKLLIERNLKKRFVNYSQLSASFKSFLRYKDTFKKSLYLKRSFYQQYDKIFKTKTIKNFFKSKKTNTLSRLYYLKKFLIHYEFRLDSLLHRLNFFSSIHESRQNIKTRKIFVNKKNTDLQNIILKKGDHIKIKNHVFFKNVLSSQIKTSSYFSFLEIDYYTQTIILLKNPIELSIAELPLFLNIPLDVFKSQKCFKRI
jgi:ribosomal protein S4